MRICACCDKTLLDFDQCRFVHKTCYDKLVPIDKDDLAVLIAMARVAEDKTEEEWDVLDRVEILREGKTTLGEKKK